jgi:hypothetical protein
MLLSKILNRPDLDLFFGKLEPFTRSISIKSSILVDFFDIQYKFLKINILPYFGYVDQIYQKKLTYFFQ